MVFVSSIKLFCLPFAGGSAMTYYKWKDYLSDTIDLRPVELSGRGKRFNQPLYNSMDEMVEDIYEEIIQEIDDAPFAFYGHSMGAILIYELIHKIKEAKHKEPVCAFFSGRYPPYVEKTKEDLHLLSDSEFMNMIYSLGGTNKDILENKELRDLFLPIIRSDYKNVETYKHKSNRGKFHCDVVALYGIDDTDVTYTDLLEWKQCTYGTCTFYELDGDHFFINTCQKQVISIINKHLSYAYAVLEKGVS